MEVLQVENTQLSLLSWTEATDLLFVERLGLGLCPPGDLPAGYLQVDPPHRSPRLQLSVSLGSLEPRHVKQVGMNSGATVNSGQSSLTSGHQAYLQSKGFLDRKQLLRLFA